jgi:hypothetical protein
MQTQSQHIRREVRTFGHVASKQGMNCAMMNIAQLVMAGSKSGRCLSLWDHIDHRSLLACTSRVTARISEIQFKCKSLAQAGVPD